MSLYTTPLQFGYFFSLAMFLVLLIRGFRNQRLSDKLLGFVMLLLALELQDYTFGFSGINVLWNELKGFPRGVTLVFGPVVYFYFRSQVNRAFRIRKNHLWHFVPQAVTMAYELFFFFQGPEKVDQHLSSDYHAIMGHIHHGLMIISYTYYFYKCLSIYKDYRAWSLQQFSNEDRIAFSWFKYFVYAMIFWIAFREIMNWLDAYYNWEFYQDWWWNLALVAVAFYIGIAGVSQPQPAVIGFQIDPPKEHEKDVDPKSETEADKTSAQTALLAKLNRIMKEDKLYLQPNLSLAELAKHLGTSTGLLSSTINNQIGANFNDYINSLRIDEFEESYRSDKNRNYTIIALAMDAGFNSKATFNRAFKKVKGSSPAQYFS